MTMFFNLTRSHFNAGKKYTNYYILRCFSQHMFKNVELDVEYFCNENNIKEIEENTAARKGIGNIQLVNALKKKLDSLQCDEDNYQCLQNKFHSELLKIPNRTHPDVKQYGKECKIVKTVSEKRKFDGKPLEFDEIARKLKLVRSDQLGNVSGSKSYYILGELAELEQALIQYFVGKLLKDNFELVSVPDILHRNTIESCGLDTKSNRNQVYSLEPEMHGPDWCLSGTSEMGLAGYVQGKVLAEDDLPLKLAAISRCYRAETSSVHEEKGIFRVHEFTKVEMFVVAAPERSDEILEDVRRIQEEYFKSLGLHFLVLDMPPHELGAPAYRKYDVEAWMCGRKMYGEISSCSNCTDYQSRRLGIKCHSKTKTNFVHTLNGTAAAIPRLLIALIEQNQNSNGTITIPEVLRKFMGGKDFIKKQKCIPDLRLIKHRHC